MRQKNSLLKTLEAFVNDISMCHLQKLLIWNFVLKRFSYQVCSPPHSKTNFPSILSERIQNVKFSKQNYLTEIFTGLKKCLKIVLRHLKKGIAQCRNWKIAKCVTQHPLRETLQGKSNTPWQNSRKKEIENATSTFMGLTPHQLAVWSTLHESSQNHSKQEFISWKFIQNVDICAMWTWGQNKKACHQKV